MPPPLRTAITACGARSFSKSAIPRSTPNGNASASSSMTSITQLPPPPPSKASAPGEASRWTKDISSKIYHEANRGQDVWSMFNPLVFPTAVNLGQGFMSFGPPAFITEALVDASSEKQVATHHYSHPKGRPNLRKAISDHYSASFRKPASIEEDRVLGAKALAQASAGGSSSATNGHKGEGVPGLPLRRPESGIPLNPETEVQVTAGANGGIYCAMLAFLEEGDEVLMFEPFFDQYICEVTYHKGEPIFIPLLPPASSGKKPQTKEDMPKADDWKIDWEATEKAMASPKAKVFILNTPNNPIGKVFSLEELQRFAALAIKYDILVLADEVYDALVFDKLEHIRIASIEGMWERTITVGSAGKSFACTGWRIGWCLGPAHLINPILVAHTRIVFCCNSPASEAAAIGLSLATKSGFFGKQLQEYDVRREQLCKIFQDLGMTYHWPSGSYFVMVDMSSIQIPEDFEYPPHLQKRDKAYKMAWFVAKTVDVVGIPATAFASDEGAKHFENYVRFSFCKTQKEFDAAAERLKGLKPYIKA